jgi:hypothetical protein
LRIARKLLLIAVAANKLVLGSVVVFSLRWKG